MCERERLPEPFVSLMVAFEVVVSPQATVAVCVSWVPASVNVEETVTPLATGIWPLGTVSGASTGATLEDVTCAFEVTAG